MILSLLATAIAITSLGDIKVQGEGYLRFAHEGRMVYAKSAALTVRAGKLSTLGGDPFMPAVPMPDGTVSVEVGLDGKVTAILAASQRCSAGQLILAIFADPNELRPESSYLVSPNRPQLSLAGEGLAGVIRMGSPIQSATISANPPVKPEIKQQPNPTIKQPLAVAPAKAGHMPYTGIVSIKAVTNTTLSVDKILLGDVAEISAPEQLVEQLKQIELGYLPPSGIRYGLSQAKIVSALVARGYKPEKWSIDVPNGCYVMRRTQKVEQKQFVGAAIAYAKTQVPPTFTFECHDADRDFNAPDGTIDLRGESFNLGASSATVNVAVYVNGKRLNSRSVRLMFSGNDGQPANRIPSGTRVKIMIRSGGAAISITGRTNSSVFIGQTVQVTSDNRTNHTGTLVDANTVEVKL